MILLPKSWNFTICESGKAISMPILAPLIAFTSNKSNMSTYHLLPLNKFWQQNLPSPYVFIANQVKIYIQSSKMFNWLDWRGCKYYSKPDKS